MSNNKQSSVEWLWDKFVNESIKISDLVKLLEQAKEIHKEETTITENTSDGYHTFKELYEIRKAYFSFPQI